MLTRAIAAGRLHEVFPRVYSVVPLSLLSVEGWHAAAVLCGGQGACLCGASAAWWTRLVKERPAEIHVAVRGRRAEVDGIRWHQRRGATEPAKHNRMPITPLPHIPADLAPSLSDWDLRGVLAELEFHHDIGPEQVRMALRKGKPGVAKLRRALDAHTPQLAATRSELERVYAQFADECGYVQPEYNYPIGTSTVDAIYRDQRIVIELDGVQGHSGERRILRDHRRDLHRRADGLLPLRYHYSQFKDPNDLRLIEAELDRYGVPKPFGTA